jgi:cytochrome P450
MQELHRRHGGSASRLRAIDSPGELPTERTHPFDPPREVAALRDLGPLCRLRYPDGHVGWLVTGHALARAVLVDSRFSMRPVRRPVGDPVKNAAVSAAAGEGSELAGEMMALDPPEHTRVRRRLAAQFSARRVQEHRPRIERIVADRLDAMEHTGPPVDLVETFARPVPSLVICELLGVPHGDRDRFERPTAVMADRRSSPEEQIAASREFTDYARGVIERKRARPGHDILSNLIARGELTGDELRGVAGQLFIAGHETTPNMLALSVLALLCDRSRWEALRVDLSSIDAAVEELLRYLTIVQVGAFTRTALEDVELEGVVIKAGVGVTVSLSAANRDPERFGDPDRLDVSRDARGHLAFGHGRHVCLGQHLARLELQVGLLGLLRRFPTLRLAVPAEELRLHAGDEFLHGVHELPVTW